MTNFEKLKEEMTVDKIVNDAVNRYDCALCPIYQKYDGCDDRTEDCKKYLKEWLCAEVDILDVIEKNYLKSVLAPWLNKKYKVIIVKWDNYDNTEEWLDIDIYSKNGYYDSVALPNFPARTMYAGMKLNKQYTAEELGLR